MVSEREDRKDMIINKTGIYDIPEEEYHKDCCIEPALSQSIAKEIYHKTPYHGFLASQRLNKDGDLSKKDHKDHFDVGTIAHSLFLEGNCNSLEIIYADSWRTKESKEKAEEARKAGKIPLLEKVAMNVKAMAEVGRKKIEESELAGIFDGAIIEKSFFAKTEDMWHRGRLDLVSKNRRIVMEYKSAASANPEDFLRSMFRYGYDIQAAQYRKLNYLTGGHEESKHIWFVQEPEPPHLCSIIGASPSIMEVGRRKLEIVEKIWKECTSSNTWPDYGGRIIWADAPDWEMARLEDREYEEMNKRIEEE